MSSRVPVSPFTCKSAVASIWELPLAVYIFSSSPCGLQFELKLQFSLLKIS